MDRQSVKSLSMGSLYYDVTNTMGKHSWESVLCTESLFWTGFLSEQSLHLKSDGIMHKFVQRCIKQEECSESQVQQIGQLINFCICYTEDLHNALLALVQHRTQSKECYLHGIESWANPTWWKDGKQDLSVCKLVYASTYRKRNNLQLEEARA